ncbi:error-prone DNA polymerase [Niabella drilacis]|uniref:Error-prone DNA polymerase n=1 Tax=Niabella drilacis (strain DSM 25811 / CCM 8410 / CCUG 62505 / LMG 26954 / E90) TaxID=1285928 RepID=A0A1G6XXS4_NIADE|nr:error-prone DNA polymerase [Niabella drilacis]SDD83024.1 error-prone DNA polymerase [Niabella drilacis]
MHYTELQVTTNFTFLRGGSHPEELVKQAIELQYTALAITDRNTLAGVVRAYAAARNTPLRIIPACRLDLADGPGLLIYPTDREAYSRLSALLTEGNLRTEKGKCVLYKADVYRYAKGMKFIVVPPPELNAAFDLDQAFKDAVREYRKMLGQQLYLGAVCTYQGNDAKKLFRLAQLAEQCGVPMVATNDVHYHEMERRELQDILTCIREKCTIQTAGYRLCQNAERHLKDQKEILRLFRLYPDAIARTQEIADACRFSLGQLNYVYPEELTTEGRTPQQELEYLAWKGAGEKFDRAEMKPEKWEEINTAIKEELAFMKRKNYASYFLTVYDLVRFARNREILCQGRGSAANSVVCYCLGITSVNPAEIKLLFARFMSDDRDEPPDIDVDFEHERREEVMQYIYEKYGRNRAGIVATVTQVHWKGAVRDVAKVMGLSADSVDHLAKSEYEFTQEWAAGKSKTSGGFMARDPHLLKTLELTRQYIGFPRQLGQHTGGFVITQNKLSDLCPILNARMEDRTCIEWNKDDIEALGFLKVDVLALGMLTCLRKGFDLIKNHHGRALTLATVPQHDTEVYKMISRADTIGVFQIESRAQMSMLPRLRPREFYDLVIEVAIVRPGPIQGDMVHPYLRRRNGEEEEIYPSEELKKILGRTKGVPLFQEQAMEIAIVAAGFTPAEADGLRRSMATFKAPGQVTKWRTQLVDGMIKKGYEKEFAERVFKQLEGFGSYGFPESHAASFALLVYISSWIKYYYPDVFCCALLNSQPMGFYRPAQIVMDAQKHGVEVLPADVNHSCWNNTLEEKNGAYCPVRLGFRQVKGVKEDEMELLVKKRMQAFSSIVELSDAGISQTALEYLADADAFRSMGLDRRQALWEVAALADKPAGVFEGQPSESTAEPAAQLPVLSAAAHVLQDYNSTSLSLKAHPVSFARPGLQKRNIAPTRMLEEWPDGAFVRIAGLVLVRQRPQTATGVCFITIEDETGIANLVVFHKVFETYRREILQSKLLMVSGKLQKEGSVIHVVVRRCYNMNAYLQDMVAPGAEELRLTVTSYMGATDAPGKKKDIGQKAVQGELFPSRNFK